MATRSRWLGLLAGVLGLACEPAGEPVFPDDYEAAFQEARDCRHSHDHELNHIRVLANELALEPYTKMTPDVPYPEGAVLLKVEYDDAACTDRVGFTAMRKEAEGYAPSHGDWRWQELDVEREVLHDGVLSGCIQCHEAHCPPEIGGHDMTCPPDPEHP